MAVLPWQQMYTYLYSNNHSISKSTCACPTWRITFTVIYASYVHRVNIVTHYALKIDFEFVALVQSTVNVLPVALCCNFVSNNIDVSG